jgi:hypothetical protein
MHLRRPQDSAWLFPSSGHNSEVVHRAYAECALMKIPSLEDCEQRASPKTK